MRTRHIPRLLMALVVALVLAVSVDNDATAQEVDEFFEVAAIEHDPSGRIVASLAVPQSITLDPTRLTVFVDGLRQPIESVSQREPVAISVVIAIDTSGSMDGAPIAAAREAAQGLIDRLNVDDQVAVVSFADQPRVLSDFTTNRSETLATIRSVTALGATALYGAVGEAATLIAQADTETRVLVLLSDGVDSGVSTVGRDESVSAIVNSGAVVYSFALQLQGEVDSAYLESLASATDGEFSSVAGEQGLSAVFASLGRRLGADVAVTVQVPPLSVGSHDFLLRFPVLGENIESNLQFVVSNAGLLVARVADAPLPAADATPVEPLDEALIVRIDAATDLYSFQLQAAVGDGDPVLLTDGADRILIDPWAMVPGPVEVRIVALLRYASSDRFAGETVVSVDVPTLEPVLNLRRAGSGADRVLVVSGRVQNTPGVIVRIFVDGDEVSNSDGFRASDAEADAAATPVADGTPVAAADEDADAADEPVPAAAGAMVTTTISVPTEAQIEVRLENAQGELLLNQFLDVQLDKLVPISAEEAAASAEGDNVQLALIGLALLLLIGTGLVVLSRRPR